MGEAQGFRGETPPSAAAGDAVLITTVGIKHQGDNKSPRVSSLLTWPGPWDHVPTGVDFLFVPRAHAYASTDNGLHLKRVHTLLRLLSSLSSRPRSPHSRPALHCVSRAPSTRAFCFPVTSV